MTDLLKLLPARPRLLGLGEPTHGEDVLLEVRNEIFRRLVEQEGFRAIAIESDCLAGLIVDDYVTTGAGSLDDVMARGFSHGFGASAANRELVRWMREYNDGRPESEQVHFAGADGPLETSGGASPRQALTALHAYLAADLPPGTAETLDRLIGDDDRWPNPAAMMDPTQSIGRSPEAVELRLLTDDLVALFEAQLSAPREIGLYARTAVGLLRYHHWMADTTPARIPRLLGQRASMMAANMLAAAEWGPALVFAHNGHLQRDRSSMRMGDLHLDWWSAGSIVSSRIGEDYGFVAMALGTIRHHGVDTPPANTIEGRLYALPTDRYAVDPATLGGADLAPRVSPWFGYAPLDPAHLANIDAIVFVKDTGE
jgi:erythromycin esterase-like protein